MEEFDLYSNSCDSMATLLFESNLILRNLESMKLTIIWLVASSQLRNSTREIIEFA